MHYIAKFILAYVVMVGTYSFKLSISENGVAPHAVLFHYILMFVKKNENPNNNTKYINYYNNNNFNNKY